MYEVLMSLIQLVLITDNVSFFLLGCGWWK